MHAQHFGVDWGDKSGSLDLGGESATKSGPPKTKKFPTLNYDQYPSNRQLTPNRVFWCIIVTIRSLFIEGTDFCLFAWASRPSQPVFSSHNPQVIKFTTYCDYLRETGHSTRSTSLKMEDTYVAVQTDLIERKPFLVPDKADRDLIYDITSAQRATRGGGDFEKRARIFLRELYQKVQVRRGEAGHHHHHAKHHHTTESDEYTGHHQGHDDDGEGHTPGEEGSVSTSGEEGSVHSESGSETGSITNDEEGSVHSGDESEEETTTTGEDDDDDDVLIADRKALGPFTLMTLTHVGNTDEEVAIVAKQAGDVQYTLDGQRALNIYSIRNKPFPKATEVIHANGLHRHHVTLHLPVSTGMTNVVLAISTVTDKLNYRTLVAAIPDPSERTIIHWVFFPFDALNQLSYVVHVARHYTHDAYPKEPIKRETFRVIRSPLKQSAGDVTNVPESGYTGTPEETSRGGHHHNSQSHYFRAGHPTPPRGLHGHFVSTSSPGSGHIHHTETEEAALKKARESIPVPSDDAPESEQLAYHVKVVEAEKAIKARYSQGLDSSSSHGMHHMDATYNQHPHHQDSSSYVISTDPMVLDQANANVFTKYGKRFFKKLGDMAGFRKAPKSLAPLKSYKRLGELAEIDPVIIETVGKAIEEFKKPRVDRVEEAVPQTFKYLTVRSTQGLFGGWDKRGGGDKVGQLIEKDGYRMYDILVPDEGIPIVTSDSIEIKLADVENRSFHGVDTRFNIALKALKPEEHAEKLPKAEGEEEAEELEEDDGEPPFVEYRGIVYLTKSIALLVTVTNSHIKDLVFVDAAYKK